MADAPTCVLCAGEDRIFTLKMTGGVIMAIVGFVAYSHTKTRGSIPTCIDVQPSTYDGEVKQRLLV